MNNSDCNVKFYHRPSVPYLSSTNISSSCQKKTSDPVPGKTFVEFKNFNYIIRDSSEKESLNKEFISNKDNGINDLSSHLERDYLTKALNKEGLGLDNLSLENILHGELKNEWIRYIYFTCEYIINNCFGASGPKTDGPQKLLQYVNQLLSLPSEIKQDYSRKARKVKAPEYILTIEIIEAKNLISTDVNCLSDPYCKVWMSNQKEIKKTSVKEKTLNPKWKECFNICLNDMKNDVIHVEIWDKDPKGFSANIKQIRNIKGLKSFRQFFRECCRNLWVCGSVETDDFVAKAEVPVKEIYSEEYKDWVALKDKKGRVLDAELHLSAEFKTLRPKQILDALKRHILLLKVCLQQSIEEHKGLYLTVVHWEQLLIPSAVTLIFQHRVQSSLTSCEDILCRFIVFIHFIQNKVSVNYQFLYSIIYETCVKMQELRSIDHCLERCLEDLYVKAINNVYNLCKIVVTNLYSIDFLEDDRKSIEFEFVLKCATLSHDIADKEEFLWPVFEDVAIIWFNQLAEEIQNTDSSIKSDFLSKKLSFILSYHSAVDNVIRSVFPEKSYTKCAFEILDSVLSENLKPHIAKLSEESLKSNGEAKALKLHEALEIFLKIKDLLYYVIKVSKVTESDIQLANFREWFGSKTIEDWFYYKEEVIISEISKIVSNDNLESKFIEISGRLEKQSISVKLAANLIQKELIKLRNDVFHQKYLELDFVFLEVLHSVSMKYSEFLMDLIYSRNILANFKSTGMKKLCSIANNLWSFSVFIQKSILDTVSVVSCDDYDTKFCLRITCSIICADICKELERDVVRRIQNIVTAKSIRSQKRAVKAYVNGIHRLFNEETRPLMAFEVYLLFMRETVKNITQIVAFFNEIYKNSDIRTVFNKCKNFCIKTPNIASGLLEVLTQTEKLCFVDDQGRLKAILWDDNYKNLKQVLCQSAISDEHASF